MPTIDRRQLERWRREDRRRQWLDRTLPPWLPLLVLAVVIVVRELLR